MTGSTYDGCCPNPDHYQLVIDSFTEEIAGIHLQPTEVLDGPEHHDLVLDFDMQSTTESFHGSGWSS